MARKKKEKKTMVIGSMVINVDQEVDQDGPDRYDVTTLEGKPFWPRCTFQRPTAAVPWEQPLTLLIQRWPNEPLRRQ